MLSDSARHAILALSAMYPQRQSALIPALTVAQDEVAERFLKRFFLHINHCHY